MANTDTRASAELLKMSIYAQFIFSFNIQNHRKNYKTEANLKINSVEFAFF